MIHSDEFDMAEIYSFFILNILSMCFICASVNNIFKFDCWNEVKNLKIKHCLSTFLEQNILNLFTTNS